MFDLKKSDLPELIELQKSGVTYLVENQHGVVFGYFGQICWDEGLCITGDRPVRTNLKTAVAIESPLDIAAAIAQIKARKKPMTLDESATDDIVLAEVYSLREKLKIAAEIIHLLDPNYDVTEFLHQVSSADYDQREEDISPLTWNERINQMTAEEKASELREYIDCASCPINTSGGCRCNDYCTNAECVKKLTGFFTSPYKEATDD